MTRYAVCDGGHCCLVYIQKYRLALGLQFTAKQFFPCFVELIMLDIFNNFNTRLLAFVVPINK